MPQVTSVTGRAVQITSVRYHDNGATSGGSAIEQMTSTSNINLYTLPKEQKQVFFRAFLC